MTAEHAPGISTKFVSSTTHTGCHGAPFYAVLKMTAVVLISVLLIFIAKGTYEWKGNYKLERTCQKKGPKSYHDNGGYLHKDMTV